MAEPKLTLNNWTLWMSADEYTGGSFFYSEGIDCTSNSKYFKLWPRQINNSVNKRTNGQSVAIVSSNNTLYSFTNDWYIESNIDLNWRSTLDTVGWAYIKGSWDYLNWIAFGDKIVGIGADFIDLIDTSTPIFDYFDIIANPTLTTSDNWTNAWGWTFGTTGATHTTGTATLFSDSFWVSIWKRYRISIKMSWCTTGSVEVYWYGWPNMILNKDSDNWTMTSSVVASWTTLQVWFMPTTWFNGTINYVSVYEYKTNIEWDKATITSASSHPAILRQWDIYIGSGKSIDIVNTTLWDVETVNIIDDWYEIRSISQIGWSLIIWASDWNNSKQYYWNGVDELASEVIEWRGLNIVNAISDETKSYVYTDNAQRKKIFLSSWYTRQCIAENKYNGRTIERSKNLYYPNKKFNFYNYYINSMSIIDDKLYAWAYGGVYTYGYDIAWLPPVWNKPITINPELWALIYAIWLHSATPYISYKDGGINFISEIREYNNKATGYLVTNPIIRDNLSTKKALNKLKIGFKNVDSTIGNIKIHAIVDDDYFWTIRVTGVSVTPTAWAIYNVWTNTKAEVISADITTGAGTIVLKKTDNTANYPWNELTTITKVSWTGDASITSTGFTNMILIKTITSDQQGYWNELIFGSSFVESHMPDWNKIQFVIELNSNNNNVSPEIYDINILSDIIDSDV